MDQVQIATFDPEETILQLKQRLSEMDYSQATIDRLDSVWRNFTQYWTDTSQTEFTEATVQKFIVFRYGYVLGDKDKAHNVNRAMNMLWDFTWYHQVFKQSSLSVAQFHHEYQDVFNGFLSYLRDKGYSEGSIRTFRSRLMQIQNFIKNDGCSNIGTLTTECMERYTASLAQNSPKTIARKLRLLRNFLKYAYDNGYITEPLAPTIPKVRVPRNIRLPAVFTTEEVGALLGTVDRSNPLGKRDYAILVLAACLGLRISDIVGLTFDEIDWSKKRLCIIQQKTGNLVELPLIEEVGWAIIDYLQNGRPQSDCDHVFIKHCAPYDALSPSMYRTIQKHLQKAGIKCPGDKATGMHTLRHSLASSMLEQKTPLPIISGTLGHTDPHSSETYLGIDLHQLRECALEVDI